MKITLAVTTGLLAAALGGCAGFMPSNEPSDAQKKQDAALQHPMDYQMNVPRDVDTGNPMEDLNRALFMP